MKKFIIVLAMVGGPQINAAAYQTGSFVCDYSGVTHSIKIQDISLAPGIVLPYVEDVVTIDAVTSSTKGFAIVSNQANGQTLFFGDSSNGRVAIHFSSDGQASSSCR